MTVAENKNVPKQALNELTSILKKPYQDAYNVCKGAGKITDSSLPEAQRQRTEPIKATLNFTHLIEPPSPVAFHKLAGFLVCLTALIYNLTTPRSADIPLFLRLVGSGQ